MAEKNQPEEYLYSIWVTTGDPRGVWRAIQSTVRFGDGEIPAWVLNYLVDVAAGIENAGGLAGRQLHGILKFPAKSGPWRSPGIDRYPDLPRPPFDFRGPPSGCVGAGVNMAEKNDGPGEYVGFYAPWVDTGDPRWVWRAIRSAIHCGDLPDWTLNYLFDVAAGIDKAGGEAGRKLHSILKFPSKPGPLRSIKQELQIERFAVEFMRRLLKGEKPGKARTEAALIHNMTGEKDEQSRCLRKFFNLKSLPPRNFDEQWGMIIAGWLLSNPGYIERYPDLPKPPFVFTSPPRVRDFPGRFT